MQPWKRKKSMMRQPKYVTVFEPLERELLGDEAARVAEALMQRCQSAPKDDLAELTGMPSGHTEAPRDPSLARLLPDFERADDESFDGENGLMRSLHESDIARSKLMNLQRIGEALGPSGNVAVQLDEEDANAWVAGLNDIRLFLAASEPETEEEERDRDEFVEWLAYNQDTLLEALMAE